MPQWVRVTLVWFLGLSGAGLMAYPLTSSYIDHRHQENIAREYENSIKISNNDTIAQELSAASEWNSSRPWRGVFDPWSDNSRGATDDYNNYLRQLSLVEERVGGEDNSVMSTLSIPAIGVDMPVYHGTSDAVLESGLGHLFGTALPVGDIHARPVITGHTGLHAKTIFDRLPEVKKGDFFNVTTYGKEMTYKVISIEVIEPTEAEKLAPVAGKDLISLITCTPYGVNSHRLVVTGERVDSVHNSSVEQEEQFFAPWWYTVLACVSIVLIVYLLTWSFAQFRNRQNKGR